MIRHWPREDGGLEFDMFIESPSVYLDHCALGMLLDEPHRLDRFITAMRLHRGTLCLSWMSLSEFCSVSDETAERAQMFLDELFPKIFLFECNPAPVIQNEDRLAAGGPRVNPIGDIPMLKALIKKPAGDEPRVSIAGLIRSFREAGLDARIEELSQEFVRQVSANREKFARDSAFRTRYARVPPGPGLPAGTRFLLSQVIRPFVADSAMTVEPNDGIDYFHTVVPVSYAQFVFLDKRWATIARQAINRLERAGHLSPFARVYGGRALRLDQFFRDFSPLAI